MKPRGHPGARRGFTLAELLVVLAITALLAAVGFQAHRTSRLRAHQVASTANLRQLATANLHHAADHQTYAPAGEPRNRTRWHGGRDGPGGRFDPARGFLAEYLGESRRVGRCPEFQRHLSGSSSWEDGSGGYGYNAIYIGGTPANPFRPNRPANVPDPSRTLMFATTAFAIAGGLQEYPFAEPRQWVDANGRPAGPLQPSVHFRFAGRALVAWCDGHVSAERPDREESSNFYGGDNSSAAIGFCGPAADNGWWNPARSSSHGEP